MTNYDLFCLAFGFIAALSCIWYLIAYCDGDIEKLLFEEEK